MDDAAPQRSGSPPDDPAVSKGQRTRRRILTAAREVFATMGFERATIRAIATAAEVDKSSVIQYFGTKEQLFREAVSWVIPIEQITVEDPAQTAENMARGMLNAWAAEPNSPMTVLLRAAMTSEIAAEILRTNVTAQAVDSLAGQINTPDARLRSVLVGAILMGIASQRYILRMPDLAEADTEEILTLVTPLLRQLISPD
ncbi:TetR/AcrR family transcriptional regulator [Mycobacterium koreense]|uniref:TetR family transcriptional regulator n=1 Tax=Mycolicibacillus koreensis TaxID=1069220 RepID=A0A7I7SFE8_9MYCO|nr:TetR family transcriptional regulator [Mycolicibacillus koreensis]MCV7248524.1 TetR/AcrR family transcriptional regulator [Mycolicibacillus koreensis]OSC32699.1 TetR family transcriptional regulator [Mycolicibacillus koreensis]BBY55483.1 putative transcriptional regulator, TetR family protein [Mycolicibacillus koreensis]